MSKEQKDLTVYKQLSTDMRQGLKDIYHQISTASDKPMSSTDALFHEATDQLDEVLKTTEAATMSIMEVVEKMLDMQEEIGQLLSAVRAGTTTPEQMERLESINAAQGNEMSNLLTSLSFQDLTGQRIKKVMTALNQIEKSVVELYVSSGLYMDAAEKDPDKDAEALKKEADQAVEDFRQHKVVHSELKGPDANGISQNAIDDMLAQLGM